ENDSPAASQGVSTVTDEDDSPAIGQRDNTVTDEDDSPAIGQGDNTVTDHVNNPAIGQGDSTTTDKDDKSAIGQGDSPAIGQVDDRTAIGNGDRRSDRNEVNPVIHNRGDQCDFSTDAAFIFQEGEKHFLVVSVELIMTGAGTKNDEAENKVPEEDKNGQTLSLHASEVNENASSSTEVGSLNTNVEQVPRNDTRGAGSRATDEDDSPAIGQGDRPSDRKEVHQPVIHKRGDQCDFSTDAAFILQEGEKHFLVVSVELVMTGAGTKNDEAENKVPEEDKNGQTLSLHASEVNENASSSTEVGSLNTNVEQGHMKLRQQNRARQLRALEKNNRSQRKILRILTERKGAHLEKEFESLRKVYALSLKKYMIIMKKQSRRMEMLIKCIRADLPDSDEDDE
ncbi:hypothetical protein B7P43_G10335, partial [Cryptotermes secundus]